MPASTLGFPKGWWGARTSKRGEFKKCKVPRFARDSLCKNSDFAATLIAIIYMQKTTEAR